MKPCQHEVRAKIFECIPDNDSAWSCDTALQSDLAVRELIIFDENQNSLCLELLARAWTLKNQGNEIIPAN